MAPEAKSLPSPPTDGVTSLSYLADQLSSGESLLASTSWDGCLRIHDTSTMTHVASHNMESGPLLSLATPGGGHAFVYTAGLDGSVRKFDIASGISTLMGQHSIVGATTKGDTHESTPNQKSDAQNSQACSCLAPVDALSGDNYTLVASAGWNRKFHIWDSRLSSPAATLELPGKAYSMDCVNQKCVIATSGRRTCLIDVRMISKKEMMMEEEEPQQEEEEEEEEEEEDDDEKQDPILATLTEDRESSLKYQTRAVRYFPNGNGLALSSIEGRVAIEYLNITDDSKKKKYAFKCHRVGDMVYPVNSIAFHPRYGTFATGGCDGTVVIWDAMNKKRLSQVGNFASSIAAMAFNHDGSELAIASSYTFEEGERDHPRDEIYIRSILDQESKPKGFKS